MGALDVPFKEVLVPQLTRLFSSIPLQYERLVEEYNPVTGATVTTTQVANLPTTPPSQWLESELQDEPGRIHALRVLVPTLDAERAGFDPKPGTESSVYVTRAGTRYRVEEVKRIASGDDEAAIILALYK